VTDTGGEPPPDLEIRAGWRARSARYRMTPQSRTEAIGDVESEELSEREHVPERVEPGRTYRNVVRRWRLSAWLRAAGR
jgi:hypothetical protein